MDDSEVDEKALKTTKRKKRRSKPAATDEETRPLSPSEPPEVQNTSLDSILRAALEDTQKNSKTKKGTKKKRKKNEDADLDDNTVLESLRQSAELVKNADDSVLLANTYNEQDSPRFSKNETNARRRKLPPKKGNENMGYVDDDEEENRPQEVDDEDETRPTSKGKKVKKKKKPSMNREDAVDESKGPLSLSELEQTPQKQKRKKKKVNKSEEDGETKEENEVDGGGGEEERPEEAIRKKKKKRKKASTDESLGPSPPVDDGRIFCVTIHRSDRLKTDLYVRHPLVRVHIVDMSTGAAVKKSSKERPVTSFFENHNENVDFIMPVLTQPFDFKQRKSLIPKWEEQLVFNESFLHLVSTSENAPKIILFFEILDFVSMNVINLNPKMLREDGAWHRIAWGFLKLIGSNGEPNAEKKVRLQLFHPPFAFKAKPNQVDVYQWWLNCPRQAYPSTLYVTVKPMQPPENVEPSSRSLYAIQKEQGLMTYKELKSTIELGLKSATPVHQVIPTTWSRLRGQMCRVPNKPTLSIAGDRKGCYVLRFSPNGRALACGCKDKDGYPIVLYEIPSGRFKSQFPGHFGIIYDLVWSSDGDRLLSASSDGTARIWNLDTPESSAEKVFPHPAFVYCARFHPKADTFLATGGYDHLIRVWSTESTSQTGELYQELGGHKGFVNALVFAKDGLSMYSGDSTGTIVVWNCIVNRDLEEWSLSRVVQQEELENVPINSLQIHPSGRRLLVHGRDNNIRMMDLRLFNIMQRYVGALNFREHLRSTLSACGSFVFCGSEDGQAYVWNTDTGDQVASYTTLGYQFPVCDITYHPYDHMVAFCSRGESHPVQIFIYDSKYPQLNYLSRGLLAEAADQTAQINEDASRSLASVMETRKLINQEVAQQKTERLERVKAKLASVMSLTHEYSPQRTTRLSTFASTQSNYDTWGSTFDNTQFSSNTKAGTPGSSRFRSGHYQSGYSRSGTPTIGLKTGSGGKAIFTFNPDLSVASTNPEEYPKVRALYDYTAQRSDELNIIEGDVIKVLHEDNDNWWMGELENGDQGYFPANYVEDISGTRQTGIQPNISVGFDENDNGLAASAKSQGSRDRKKNSRGTSSSHFSAVTTKDGNLKILSGPEDSEIESTTKSQTAKKSKRKKQAHSSGLPSGSKKDTNLRKSLLETNFQKGSQSLEFSGRDEEPRSSSTDAEMQLDRRRKKKKNHAEREV
ncbi:jouberin-like isoform X2 [Apostichopus japonicus]|uniref:jouberin-like isoform X2 n=1 Tax=Stichopus japonicus TaxID=307972 RepID=UPI003AB59BEE